MGTDITVRVEVRVDGKWLHYDTKNRPELQYDDRWSTLFGALGLDAFDIDYPEVPKWIPRGLPTDCSKNVENLLSYEGYFGASWLTIPEAYAATEHLPQDQGYWFSFLVHCADLNPEHPEDVRIVYAFDN